MPLNSIAIGVTILVGMMLFRRRVVGSAQWRATVTPLASIIGSGFLIIAPLLHSVMGKWALLGIVGLSVFAYGLGWVIRYNILHAEPILQQQTRGTVARLEQAAQWSLGAAYAISVAFYLSLFIAFVFDRIGIVDPTLAKWATTALLMGIMGVAWWRGARGLEWIELFAVSIKLAIIIGVLVALLTYDVMTGTEWFAHDSIGDFTTTQMLAMLAGMLMVTQGFETARFMGAHYSVVQRINAVKYSQWIATALYIIFIGLTCPIFLTYPIVELNETTISHTLGQVVWVLPLLLLVAATASQLSAALADTIGGGGLLRELAKARLPTNLYYMLIIALAAVLVWVANVFEIINFASKGFALYYLIQVLIALQVMARRPAQPGKALMLVAGGVMACLLVFVIGWSIPAPHS
ncbi:hypothetical protein [Dasania marina]|uniref:hypothetical protein n=1 Tax=Dasania marina TaxID=471499 RepID=UPI0030DAC7D6|tara:strand:+ start:6530 stop:7750 length:1221 start_codon:yes stop_codon:yes gene_type:complete